MLETGSRYRENMMIFDAFTISGAFVVVAVALVLFYVVKQSTS